jgi:hypothetical protein
LERRRDGARRRGRRRDLARVREGWREGRGGKAGEEGRKRSL